jgi:hypothetical protein
MAKNPKNDPSRIAEISSFIGDATRENDSSRGRTSKRGLTKEETSQICFRIEKARHRALRLYCVQSDIEIGEFMDELLGKAGF